MEVQESLYQERIGSLEEQVTVMDMKMKEVEAEKELYFSKLSQLDEFIADTLASTKDGGEKDPAVLRVLSQINQILFAEENGRQSLFQSRNFNQEDVAPGQKLLADEPLDQKMADLNL